MTDNRIYVKDYWEEREIILAYSRQDKGLIAVGTRDNEGGETFIHLNVNDIKAIIEKSKNDTKKILQRRN